MQKRYGWGSAHWLRTGYALSYRKREKPKEVKHDSTAFLASRTGCALVPHYCAELDNPPHWFRTTDSSAKYRPQKKICALVLRTGTSAEIHNCALTTSLRTGYALVSA